MFMWLPENGDSSHLKGHSHLLHMRNHFIANLHIAKDARAKTLSISRISSQNSACIRVILEEQLCTDGRVQGKPKVNEYLGSRRIRRGEKHK